LWPIHGVLAKKKICVADTGTINEEKYLCGQYREYQQRKIFLWLIQGVSTKKNIFFSDTVYVVEENIYLGETREKKYIFWVRYGVDTKGKKKGLRNFMGKDLENFEKKARIGQNIILCPKCWGQKYNSC
jgi:hypothetical protein